MTTEIFIGLPERLQNAASIGISLETNSKEKNLDTILNLICNGLNLKNKDVRSRSRKRELVTARMIAIGISYRVTDNKLKEIGSYFDRDHSTVIYNRDLFNDLVKIKDPLIMKTLNQLNLDYKFI